MQSLTQVQPAGNQTVLGVAGCHFIQKLTLRGEMTLFLQLPTPPPSSCLPPLLKHTVVSYSNPLSRKAIRIISSSRNSPLVDIAGIQITGCKADWTRQCFGHLMWIWVCTFPCQPLVRTSERSYWVLLSVSFLVYSIGTKYPSCSVLKEEVCSRGCP